MESRATNAYGKKEANSYMIPETYAQWIEVLDLLKAGNNDQEVLNMMKKGTLHVQVGVIDRFTSKLIEIIKFRIHRGIDNFHGFLHNANGREAIIIQSIRSLKKELNFLYECVSISSLPVELSKKLQLFLIEQSKEMQESLEKSSELDRTGKLKSIIKKNKIEIEVGQYE